jgi:hypothetical protein
MLELSTELQTAIDNVTGALAEMDATTKLNFLFHVIAKGEQFYMSAISDPDFCLYMLDQWQPLYTYMNDRADAMREDTIIPN